MENVVPGPIFHDLMLWKALKSRIGRWGIKAFGGPQGLSFGVIQAAIQLRAASFKKPSPSFFLSQGELYKFPIAAVIHYHNLVVQ